MSKKTEDKNGWKVRGPLPVDDPIYQSGYIMMKPIHGNRQPEASPHSHLLRTTPVTLHSEPNCYKEHEMKVFIFLACLTLSSAALADEYLGKLSANPYNPDSTSNPHGQHGSEYSSSSINNPNSRYGSQYSNDSATNPYATNAPKLYDSNGNYRGKLSSNKYDPDSVSNPHGRYGSEYSSDSINNQYGAGSPYRADSPNNPYGEGMSIYGDDDG